MNSNIEIYLRQDGTQIVNVNVGGMVIAKPAGEWLELAHEIMNEIVRKKSIQFNPSQIVADTGNDNMDKLTASEALFGFMGWLTTLETPVTFSSRHNAAAAAELVDEFCKANKLTEPCDDWELDLVFPSSRSTRFITWDGLQEFEAPVETAEGMKIGSVYADGGVIGSNPSEIGGTYAYRLIEENGKEVHYIDKAFVLTAHKNGGLVTNNQTEMLAVLSALEQVPDDWAGTLYSDSQVTLGRVFMGWKWANVPKFMHEKYKALRARLSRFEDIRFILLDGHPTKAQLLAGKGKRGRPVSEHNVWCDHACTEAGELYLAQVGELVKELSSVEL